MTRLFLRLIINALALWVAAWAVPGVTFRGELWGLLVVAIVFGLVNALIRPVVKFLALPLLVLTLGLITFVINAFMLWLTAALTASLVVTGFWPAFWGSLVVTVVSFVLSLVLGEKVRKKS